MVRFVQGIANSIAMGKEKSVFVGILRIGDSIVIDQVHASTSLKGLCRLICHPGFYEVLAKGLKRKGGITEFDSRGTGDRHEHWGVWRLELDIIWGRGDKQVAKKMAERTSTDREKFRGYRGDNGRLSSTQGKKNRMGYDEVVNTWKEGDPE